MAQINNPYGQFQNYGNQQYSNYPQYNTGYQPMYQQYPNPQAQGYQQFQNQPLNNPQIAQRMNNSIPGRLINDVNEVAPNEVSMDGTVSFFPLKDYSCIYAKIWNSDGTIGTYKFVPEKIEQDKHVEQKPVSLDLSEVMKRFDKIENYLEDIVTTPNFKVGDSK